MDVRIGTNSNIKLQLAQLCRVLESLGYEVVDSEPEPICSVVASHQRSPKIIVLLLPGTACVEAFWRYTDRAKSDREGLLSFLNRLNEETSQVTCIATEYAPGLIRIRAQFSAPYTCFHFLCFMRSWMQDVETIFRIVRTQGRGFFEGEDHPKPSPVRANGRPAERQQAGNGETGKSKDR